MKLTTIYTPISIIHTVYFKGKHYNMSGEVQQQREWCTGNGWNYSFAVNYGFEFRAWLRRITDQKFDTL